MRVPAALQLRRGVRPRAKCYDRAVQSKAAESLSPSSTDALFQDVYSRLKAMAARQRRRASGATLCTTEIVHELYLRIGESAGAFAEPAQFFAYAARAMRHLLVDHARRRLQIGRGGGWQRATLSDPAVEKVAIDPQQALELDSALSRLEHDDERAAKVLELHYFGGLPLEQIAQLLDVGERTVDRDMRYARSFLNVELRE